MLLNARLKQLCKSIKARFIDLSRELTSKGTMQKDGLQYGEEGIRVVTERLGLKATDGEEVWAYYGLGKGKHGSSFLHSKDRRQQAVVTRLPTTNSHAGSLQGVRDHN
ncbi:hypothetical protein HPB47_024328 [Ixodes persulcatus]|uniref:Uncharacterized protein n=1 Tax=Ixodes persulcatus TaxID=34615 RepID=A0AC60Q4P1_IXOPE|nr:hypothetical protein HPB47_024328 [Ixodes persulcatus]